MSITMYWPILLIAGVDIIYQICAKETPSDLDPLASLAVTYAIASVSSFVIYLLLNRGSSLTEEYSHLNWASFLLGIAVVGLEAGSIYMYRVGWNINTGYLVKSMFVAVTLIALGVTVYHESISSTKLMGIAICAVGLYFINK